MKNFNSRDLFWALPFSLSFGGVLSSLQPGNWFSGWLSLSFIFLLCFFLLTLSINWAKDNLSANNQKTLVWMVVLAFALRFAGGVATYLALPINGFEDEDDKAGFIFTDAHRRDTQAWELSQSEHPIIDAFNKKFAYDQYGGLLAFSAFTYRYLSPDAHRPLLLVLLASLAGALGLPFLWKAISLQWDIKTAFASSWIFALYPESILLGGSSMREPYLMLFSTFVLWGFVNWILGIHNRQSIVWAGIGIAGMLLVSPVMALVTMLILAGWLYFSNEHSRISWWAIILTIVIFIAGLFLLSAGLNRSGQFETSSPLRILAEWMNKAVEWDVYQLERDSGWVQKVFRAMPNWLHLPFVMVYGIFQPVLPATLVEPTTLTWRIISVLRALGWYALLPVLVFSLVAASSQQEKKMRRLLTWITSVVWIWILITALRGGGDQWDNPRYRAFLMLWQALLAGFGLGWWIQTRNAWLMRILAMEGIFLLFFSQWYVSRYLQIGSRMSFEAMVILILFSWGAVIGFGIWRDIKIKITDRS